MPRPSRPVPRVGMTVQVVRLGVSETATVDEIRDDGRTIVADGEVFTLRRLTSHFVLEGEPYYGPRLSFGAGERPPRDEPDASG